MPFFQRERERVDYTPVFTKTVHSSLSAKLFKPLILPIAVLMAFGWFGQPALRIHNSWYGNEQHPTHTHCIYLALDGWHDIRPTLGINQCPLVKRLPIDLWDFLIG